MDCKKKCKIKRVRALRGGLEKKVQKLSVGALRGRWRVDCEKCKIKKVGALRGRWRVDCEKKKCKVKTVWA